LPQNEFVSGLDDENVFADHGYPYGINDLQRFIQVEMTVAIQKNSEDIERLQNTERPLDLVRIIIILFQF